MNDLAFTIHETAGTDDEKNILQHLREYNIAQTDIPPTAQPLIVCLRDDRGEMVAGLCAKLQWGWLYIDLLWVHQSRRGQGLGSQLLRRVEAEALKKDCKAAHLFTYSFQAPGFYEQHGYTKFAELSDYPVGHSRIYFKKSLA